MAHISIFTSRKADAAAASSSSSSCRRGGAGAATAASRSHCGANCGLGRLMRKLRKQSKMLCMATKPATFHCQYDPLSYSRNFDRSGFGTALDEDSAHFYHTFSSSDLYHRVSEKGQPPVERLFFHLPNEQYIVYEDGESLSSVIEDPRNKESMFTTWFEANRMYEDAKLLTYAEFPSKFVYNTSKRKWFPRKKGFSIGRLHHVPPTCRELYYQRILLTKIYGPQSYKDIRTIGNIVYPTYRDACYELGLLNDDKEYIEAIQEAYI
ncbi:hypothetical protein Cni_G26634 [Canna indica]|uniref:Uncharacterized protein n=1 Tax=Canna indica TaxID=4628 RepID=A0AAQ3QM90_9LILI|nr:hypothetical protein Cni_G26634 [Canna indica]